jgi:hypothetical protein
MYSSILKVHSFSTLPKTTVTAMSVSFKNSLNRLIIRAICPTLCYSLVNGFSSLGFSIAYLAFDFIVNLNKDVRKPRVRASKRGSSCLIFGSSVVPKFIDLTMQY